MKKRNSEKEGSKQTRLSRRIFLKTLMFITFLGGSNILPQFVLAEDIPAEPDNLDEPTQWQEGDPEPVEMAIPAEEPEQTSTEAPPSQPMDDERPPQPAPDYAWAYGYWWWTNGTYVWVPGYWVVPPHANYVYVSGYWNYSSTTWVYVRGGWAKPNTTVIVTYPAPRPVWTAFVFTAPIRIVRRHHRWRHYHKRHYHHNPRPRPTPHASPKPTTTASPKPTTTASPNPTPTASPNPTTSPKRQPRRR